jgi:thiosulfate/3-mercaptopyruvate sulfurtransferase
MSSSRSAVSSAFAALALAATLNTALAQSARPTRADLIVNSAWLSDHLNDADLVLLHVGDKAEYEKSHIPGARFVSMQDVSISSMDHDKGLMLELPNTDTLRAHLAALGISDNSRIVVYYGNDWVSPSTRILLTLDFAGLGSHSALLDGGMNAWKETGHVVTAEPAKQVTGKLSQLKTHSVVVDINYVQSHLKDADFHLIDGRGAVFYDGVELGSGRKGHIAGAHSIPFTEVTDDKLHLKSADQLVALFAKAGVGPRDTVVAYCHIGQQATAVLFAARTLGHPVLLFDGSYQEWGRRPDLPIENPADGGKKQ